MRSIKYKIIIYLIRLNIFIGRKLLLLRAHYEANSYSEKNNKFDLRNLPDRIKNVLIHDKSIIEKRLSICGECENFNKTTSQCSECGCFMKIKARIATVSCPMDPPKWYKEYNFIKGKVVGTQVTA